MKRPGEDVRRGAICYVTDRRLTSGRPLLGIIEGAIRGGVDLIQIRDKDLAAAELLKIAQAALEMAKGAGGRCRIMVNDRLDVALAARASGVHLPGDGLPPREVRSRVTRRFLIGRSIHALAEGRDAAKAGVDYLFFGPVFATPDKAAFGAPQGVDALRKVAGTLRLPVWAIGGVSLATVAELHGVPIAGIAAIRAIGEADDPAGAVGALRAALLAPEP